MRSSVSFDVLGNLNNNSRYAFGYIDEMAVYHSALSSTRIQAHYNAGAKGSCNYKLKEGYWYHIAGHVDDTSKTLNLYLNGQRHCQISIDGVSTLLGSSEDLTIGRSDLGSETSWAGKVGL